MYQENVVLCGASAYEQKYYFNQDFDSLPESIKQELHIMCVLYTEDIGGILTLEFDDNGSLQFKTDFPDECSGVWIFFCPFFVEIIKILESQCLGAVMQCGAGPEIFKAASVTAVAVQRCFA